MGYNVIVLVMSTSYCKFIQNVNEAKNKMLIA